MRRSQNQDSFKVMLANSDSQWERRGHFFMVADGMGAHAAGELASEMAVDNVPHLYAKYSENSPPEGLQRAIVEANAEIHHRGSMNADFHAMGTTASCLVLLPQGAMIGHVGDSRVYRMRGNTLHQLTFDHSLVWELRAANQIPEGDGGHNIPKNVITRSLGPNPTVQVDVEGPIPVELGDTFLLCSDGLTGPVDDREIAAILATMSPAEAAEALVHLANLRGGPDNTTVIIARVDAPEMCTANAKAPPLSIGRHDAPPTPPALWVAPVICLLVAIVLFLATQPVLAIALLLVGLGALGYVGVQRLKGAKGIQLNAQRRLGKGPYTQVEASGDATEAVRKMVKTLHERADEIGWDLNWQPVDQHLEESKSEPEEAGAHLSKAFRCLMTELRSFLSRQASDSAIEL